MKQAFNTLGGSDTEAISADKLKELVNLFDLNADELLNCSANGQVVSTTSVSSFVALAHFSAAMQLCTRIIATVCAPFILTELTGMRTSSASSRVARIDSTQNS